MSTLIKRYFFFILGSFVGKIIIQDISGGISVFKAFFNAIFEYAPLNSTSYITFIAISLALLINLSYDLPIKQVLKIEVPLTQPPQHMS